jgi:DNA-binding response OmpR family regulator
LCILLVEDEALVRDILAEELVEAGFEVLQAENGDEAARLIETGAAVFTLLITDIHMPGALSGRAVAQLMHRHNPCVPVIYITGRPDIFEGMGPLGENEAILSKPFRPSELLRKARGLLVRKAIAANKDRRRWAATGIAV